MLELLLFRHAKSRPGEPGVEDHDRGLAPRGKKAAARMGRLIAAERLVPDLVLCSTAKRAVRTWELASAELQQPLPLSCLRSLYMASPNRLLEIVGGQGPGVRRLMVVGHNPGLQGFALQLIGEGEKKLRTSLAEKLPTAALVAVAFDVQSWNEAVPGRGKLVGFWRPRDLA